jgi:cell division protein FtsW (lipid II flippase)
VLRAFSNLQTKLPLNVVTLVIIIGLFGVLNIASAAQATRSNLYLMQLLWLFMGIVFCLVVAMIDTRRLALLTYPLYIVVILMLLLVLVVGTPIKGAQRWIDLGAIRLQPSELSKLAVVMATAKFCADYQRFSGYRLRDLIRPFNITRPFLVLFAGIFLLTSQKVAQKIPLLAKPTGPLMITCFVVGILILLAWFFLCFEQIRKEGFHFYQVVSIGDVVLLPFLLILVEPDLATSLIVLAIAGTMILFCGVRWTSIAILAGAVFCLVLFAWNFVLMDYQKQRVETFLNPTADVRDTGYQAAQSIIAIGSGQFFGKGFGGGTQTQLSFLPENHTDFAFAVLAEEWGFFGAGILVCLFLALILAMIKVAAKVQDRYASLLIIGSAAMIFWHATFNMGMVTGLLPVAGVPLPFLSYGGASMLTQMAAVAFCLNAAVWRRIK